MSSLGIQSRTTVAVRDTGYHLSGCSAYMAIIFKNLSCCMKHAPEYLVLVVPIIIWLFILALHQTYKGFKEVIEDWKSHEASEKSGQRFRQGTDQATGKPKRKNHRGGVKAKKARGKREDTGSSNSGEN
ncbi:uncharacterized protein EAE97_005958 [Botrytis byssoidea]|uniref:Uncharacterized protein n=1 Tax=Botrytis byssoidea TaxID=139641 RepID=A0A9P5IJT4_9HELO|nr:uncharacterized protein EAE97_005958 [Botrytis byssoidea]KAF7943888.1 hypothetical protein EAE97_005958 [Botrytis byssoidea]